MEGSLATSTGFELLHNLIKTERRRFHARWVAPKGLQELGNVRLGGQRGAGNDWSDEAIDCGFHPYLVSWVLVASPFIFRISS